MQTLRPVIPCLVLALFFIVIPVSAETPSVMVADYSISPPVLQPGDVGTITAIIRTTASSASIQQNTGIQSGGTSESIRSTDISVNIESVQLESRDVEVLSGNYKQIGSIGPGQSIPITFLIRAPAKDGIYFPEIWIDVTGGQSVRQPVPVNVNTQIALLKKPALTILKTVPDGTNPGDEVPVSIVVRNDGLSRADKVTVVVNCSSPSITQKTPSTFHVGTLEKGENSTIAMVFLTDKNAPIGISRVCLTVSYVNPDGSTTTENEVIGVHVRGRAKIGIASVSTDPVRIKKGDPVSLVIRLENTGTDNANSVKASIDLPVSGSKDAYVGKIEPDSDAPAVFALKAGEAGTYPYNLTIQYEDDYGVQVRTETLTMTVFDDGQPLMLAVVFIIIAVLLAGGYYYLRVRKGSGDA